MESEKLQSVRDQRDASFHEAGHAVAAWLLGLAVGGVEIAIDDDDAKGVAHVQEAAHLDILDQLAICAAGMEAQKLFDAPTHEGAGWSDYGRMLELLDDDLEESERKRLPKRTSRPVASIRLGGGICNT